MSDEIVKQPAYRNNGIIPFGSEWEAMREQADVLVKSGFLPPDIKTAEQALAIMLAGREIGVPGMQSIADIQVINGRPSLKAELMLALAYRNVPDFKFSITGNEQVAKATAQRRGCDPVSISFSMSDAQRAGLAGKDAWKKYGPALLRARATSAVLRIVAPDAIRGMYSPDELGASEREIEVDKLVQVSTPTVAIDATIEGETSHAD